MVLLRHLRSPQPRSSFIVCFDPLVDTLTGVGGGGSTVVINNCASGPGFQPLLLLFNQIQQDDLSAVWPSFLTAFLLCLPVTPSAENSRHTDSAGNPLQLISTGKFHVFQGVHHISLFFSLPFRIFLTIEISNR